MNVANNSLLQHAKCTWHAFFHLVSNRKPFDGVAYLPLCAILLLLPSLRDAQAVVDSTPRLVLYLFPVVTVAIAVLFRDPMLGRIPTVEFLQ
ncbi:hypothetical protein DFS33DRAFT_1292872, partial [Desarmillaria ectypa]